MAVNSWQSLLPSAFKAQDPNTQIQASRVGAENALTGAQTAVQAVDAMARNQDRLRKLSVQAFVRDSMRTSIDPRTGKLITIMDPDRARAALRANPTQEGFELYSKMYPQMATEATNRALSGAITPEGGYDPRQVAAGAMQSGELGSTALNTGLAQQTQQIGAAATQAGSKATLDALAVSPAGAAPAGSIVGNEQLQVRKFGSPAQGPDVYKVNQQDIDALPPAARRAAVINLRAAGYAVPDDASTAEIAAAVEAGTRNHVMSGLKLKFGDTGDLASAYASWNIAAPAMADDFRGKIFGNQLDIQAKTIANTRAGIETEGLAAGVAKTEDLAAKLLIPSSAIGSKVSPEMQARIDQADDAVNALAELRENMAGIVKEIDSGKINPNTPDGSKRLVADLVAQIGVINRIYGTGSTEGGVERALIDIGAPPDLANAIATHGVDAVKTWVSGKTINWRGLLADAPKRAVHSVTGALAKAKSSDPARVLRNAGHSDIMPKEHLKPSVFVKKPAKSTPNDPLGILGGAK